MRISRRFLLSGGAMAATLAAMGGWRALAGGTPGAGGTRKAAERFEVTLSDDAWRQKLSPAQYAVLRNEATERPFSSPLNDEHRNGIFACAGCQLDCSPRKPSSTAVPAGPASGHRWSTPWPPPRTVPSACCAPRSIADAAAVTWGTSSTTARSRPACAIA